MQEDRRDRALEIAQRAGAEALLAAHPGTVTWLTGFAADIELGPSPFTVAPLAVLAPGEAPILVVSEDDAPVARELGCETETYTGFTIGPIAPLAGGARLRAAGDDRARAVEPRPRRPRLSAPPATGSASPGTRSRESSPTPARSSSPG